MDLTVVIPACNEEVHLPEQLDALLGQTWDGSWEVIVVDNGSKDGTADVVATYCESDNRVRYVLATAKADWSYAENVGVKEARADIVVFCDADDIVADGWLAAMASGLSRHQVVTGPNEIDRLNAPWLARSRGTSAHEPAGSFFGIFPMVRGNNYGVRREVWDVTGPLAEDFSPHGVVADQEFSLRCWLNNIEIVGLPDAVVHYRYRSDARSLWRQGFAYGAHRPHIVKLLREAGRARPPRLAGWKSWLTLLTWLPGIVSPSGRARYAWVAGNRAGQVVGSIRHGALLL